VSFASPFEFWGTEVIHSTSHDILFNPCKLGVNKRHHRNSERLQVLSQLGGNALTVWLGGQTAIPFDDDIDYLPPFSPSPPPTPVIVTLHVSSEYDPRYSTGSSVTKHSFFGSRIQFGASGTMSQTY